MAERRVIKTRARRGHSLVAVIVLLTVVFVLALGLMGMSVNSLRLSVGRRDGQKAFDVAEAGLQHKVRQIAENGNKAALGTTPFGDEDASGRAGSEFRVDVSVPDVTKPTALRVVSTGRVKSLGGGFAERRVMAMVDTAVAPRMWDYGIVSDHDIVLAKNSRVGSNPLPGQGAIHANGSVVMGDHTVVDGAATAVVNVRMSPSAAALSARGKAARVPLPTLDRPALREQARQSGGTWRGDIRSAAPKGKNGIDVAEIIVLRGEIIGDVVIGGNDTVIIEGLVWVTGTVRLAGQSYSGSGTLISESRMTIENNSGFTGAETNSLALVSLFPANDAIIVGARAEVSGGLFSADEAGGISLGADSTVYGMVAARKAVNVGERVTVTRPLGSKPSTGIGDGVRVLYWKELAPGE